jgi:hypothetical protein
MTNTLFDAPLDADEPRRTWLFTDATHGTLVEAASGELYATTDPAALAPEPN